MNYTPACSTSTSFRLELASAERHTLELTLIACSNTSKALDQTKHSATLNPATAPSGEGGYKYPPPSASQNTRVRWAPTYTPASASSSPNPTDAQRQSVAQKPENEGRLEARGLRGLSHPQPPRTCPCQVVRQY